MIEKINAAQTSIHIASFEFNLTPVAEALIAAKQRGVDVRWVTDDESGLGADEEPDRGQFAMLQNAGLEVRSDDRSALMHNKFWIFDGRTVWTGSTNITENGIFKQDNNTLVIHSPELAAIYEREFQEMSNGEFGPTSTSQLDSQAVVINQSGIAVIFTSEDSALEDAIVPLVASGNKSIRFRAFSFTAAIDLRTARFEDALNALATSTRNFYRVTAPRTITVVPDTAAKRREYEEEIVRTFYLSNADLKETIDLLRIVIDVRKVSAITATNAITIQDTPERVAAAGKVRSAIDKARPELIIDVELLEVNRTKLREYGLPIASPDQPGISGQVNINREGMTLEALRNLTQADIFLTGLPSLYYRLLKNDSNTRVPV